MQKILSSKNDYKDLEVFFKDKNYKNIMIVCGHSFYENKLYSKIIYLSKIYDFRLHFFDRFEPNPQYSSVCDGIKEFHKEKCDFIIAVGGGSAIDVAKCIKLFSNMDDGVDYLSQSIVPNDIPFMAIPTTAGTGSEATHFAVIYYNGEKKSVTDYSSIPDYVLFDYNSLKTLPLYQKKATLLDALSHSIESIWSINSTIESIDYAAEAIRLIFNNMDDYLNNDDSSFESILKAANLAGKAINITKTTAGHAMCYKLTSLYKIPHGHAAILVNSELYPYMMENLNKCIDIRGQQFLCERFNQISILLGCSSKEEALKCLRCLLHKLGLYDVKVNEKDLNDLVKSVNIERLSNNPIKLDNNDIEEIYKRLFRKIKEENNEGN